MGVLGVVLVYKSGLRILIRAPEVPFLAAPKWLKLAIDFCHFLIEIPIVIEKNYGQRKEWSYSKNKKCSEICEQNGTT